MGLAIPISNEELSAAILPWAKAEHADKYAATLAVASRPGAFRNYLVRLIELRWETDTEWRHTVPLRVLEATGLRVRMRHRETGYEFELCGRRATPRAWGFDELRVAMQAGLSFATMRELKEGFDLVLNDPDVDFNQYLPVPTPAPALESDVASIKPAPAATPIAKPWAPYQPEDSPALFDMRAGGP